MERWLSRPLVLISMCVVLLVSALNRHDPMVYGMFLFLAMVSLLGFLLPWLSLRSMAIRLDSAGTHEVDEGTDCDLGIVIERRARWPAFMVDVESEWLWGTRRFVLRQTVPVVRAGRTAAPAHLARFACRGRYELVALHLSSGFPLGLIRAHHSLKRPQLHLDVLPHAQRMHWPAPWRISEDPRGELTTRRLGQSCEFGMLRPYQPGEPVGRVSWRASARVGELVIQHFQESGSIRLRVVVELPEGAALGDGDSADEQAIRLALGVCDAALAVGARLHLHLTPAATEPITDRAAIRRALASACASSNADLLAVLRQVAQVSAAGEQVALVVRASCPPELLLTGLRTLADSGCQTLVCIALARRENPAEGNRAQHLRALVKAAGYALYMEAA
jgi:uncharacterized protein (DUF58 family)